MHEEGGKNKNCSIKLHLGAGKIWNKAPRSIKEAATLLTAKTCIKQYCRTLPIVMIVFLLENTKSLRK